MLKSDDVCMFSLNKNCFNNFFLDRMEIYLVPCACTDYSFHSQILCDSD